MKSEAKCLDEIEDHYNTEYALREDIHSRKGEIEKLEYLNAKHCREIERLQDALVGRDKSIADLKVKHYNDVKVLINRINELGFELNIRNVPAMKESLKSSARLAFAQEDEIDRLNKRIFEVLEIAQDGRGKDLFEYLKALLIEIPSKDGIASINPDDIDIKYIEAACRYSFPVLFDRFAVLSENERHKIELADSILHKFGIETMAKYEELIQRGDIDIDILDHRVPHPPKGL